jgi:hypothetical protein
MVGYVYRMNLPTLGIHSVEGKRVSMLVSTGAIITIVNGPLDGTRLVDVKWDDLSLMMFTVDIRERGTPLESMPQFPEQLSAMACAECSRLQAEYRETVKDYEKGITALEKLIGGDPQLFDAAIQRLKGFRGASELARQVLDTHRNEAHNTAGEA